MHTAIERIDRMIDTRARFDRIETMIEDRSDLSADCQSALWLYAWVETDRQQRRQAVGEILQALHLSEELYGT